MRIEPYTDISGKQIKIKFVRKILWKHKNTDRSCLRLTDEKTWQSGWLVSLRLLSPAVIDYINRAVHKVVSSYKVLQPSWIERPYI